MTCCKATVSILVAFSLCNLLASVTESNADSGRGSATYVFSLDSKGIRRNDTASHVDRMIFSTAGMHAVSMSVAPSDTVVALLVTDRGIVPPSGHDYSVPPRNSMIVINANGLELARLDDDIRKFSWSPDGEKIAFIAGTYYEGGVGFLTTGVWVYSLQDGRRTRINKDFPHDTVRGTVGGGYNLNWAKHDSNIYIQDFDYLGGVYRYNTRTGKSEKVAYKGIGFSPDGKYYLAELPEEGCRLYASATNEDVTERVTSRFGYLPQSWTGEGGHNLLATKVQYKPSPFDAVESSKPTVRIDDREIDHTEFFIYDVANDLIVRDWVEHPTK
jgi:hypothetical protein